MHPSGAKFVLFDENPEEFLSSKNCTAIENTSFSFVAGFQCMFNSNVLNVLDPQQSHVHQDMTHPLSDYFIDSSHNTYVTFIALSPSYTYVTILIALSPSYTYVTILTALSPSYTYVTILIALSPSYTFL